MPHNPFEKFGIEHLSPSSLNLYRAEPAYWSLRYLHRVPDEVGPQAWRGSAVEAGLDWLLYRPEEKQQALAKALERFELDAQGDLADNIAKERDCIPAFLEQAALAFKEHGAPVARQLKVSVDVPGIEVPVIGFIDYSWDGFLHDLKTTHRLPSSPKSEHLIQVSLYHKATGKTPFLTYCTTKKWAAYEADSASLDTAWKALCSAAHAVRNLLALAPDKAAACAIFTPDYDSFYWSDQTKTAAKEIWP